jgi:soluble lytic murein transglycosylase-like protein
MYSRPTQPPASRHRCRRLSEPGPAQHLALAGILILAAVLVAPAPALWGPKSPEPTPAPADVIREAALPPAPVIAKSARIGKAEAMPRPEQLATIVARRYSVAQDAAFDVVRVAFREGQRYGLDPMLILAVIAVESRFNPDAESEQGAMGLMQVVPRFHPEKIAALGMSSVLLPEANIALGTRILRDAIRRGGSDVAAGLQLYNGAVTDETQAYANRVLTERKRIEGALPRPRAGA